MDNKQIPLYEVTAYTNLRQLMEDRAVKLPDKPVFSYMDYRKEKKYNISSSQFLNEMQQYGTWLFAQGYRKTKIAILGENSYQWLLSFLSVIGGNNIAVPLDKELSPKAIMELLTDSESRVLIYSDAYIDVIQEIQKEMNIDFINMNSIPGILNQGMEMITEGNRDYIDHEVDEDNVSIIVYTSGTTGKSKGVMLSHKNIAIDCSSAAKNCDFSGDSLLLLPLHHTYGMVAGVFLTIIYGGTVYINLSLRYLKEDLKLSKSRVLFLVPLLVETLYKNIWKEAEDSGKAEGLRAMIEKNRAEGITDPLIKRKMFAPVLEALGGKTELVISGGALLNPKYIEGFRDFGIELLNGYGISECSPIIAVNRDVFHKDGSIGYVVDACEVRIDQPDENGEGEICARGDIVMQGYYKREDLTKEAIVDGWFHTGDIGHLDEDHFLYITGRKKNLIILNNGENVSPEELENELQNILLIKEVIVYAEDGMICAEVFQDQDYIERYDISDPQKQIRSEVADRNRSLPIYKQIKKVIFRDSAFDKTTTKKIIRHHM